MNMDNLEIEKLSKLGQRGTYGYILNQLADNDEKIVALTADLIGASNLKEFSVNHKERLVNVGIAEQNMMGISAGMAKNGFKTYASTFAPFASMRSCEQLKLFMGYMKLNMKVIGMASGFSMGALGNTHYCIEDLGILKSIPNIIIESPADCYELAKCLEESTKIDKPMYIRLTGEKNMPMVYQQDYKFEIGKGIKLKDGKDIVIFATGSMVYEALETAKRLEENNISASVVDIHTIKPIDKDIILKESKDKKLVVTIEEHNIDGGLGSSVSDVLSQSKNSPIVYKLGVEDEYPPAASYKYMMKYLGLVNEEIAKKVVNKIGEIDNEI